MAFAAIPAGLSTLLTIASIGVGIAGVAASTSAAMQANNYQQQVLERNRLLMEENAQRAIHASQQAQIQQDDQTRALLGEQLATQSASGLKLGGRSQVLTRKSARMLGRLDAETIRQAGEIEAYNFRQAAEDAATEGKFLKQQQGSILLSGFLDAASVGLTGLRSAPTQLSSLMGGRKSSIASTTGGYKSNLRFAR